jgi:hypothetical protein
MALKTHRPVDIRFHYLFDREDLERIGRAQNKKPRDLTNDDINQYVSDILTLELEAPDPLE